MTINHFERAFTPGTNLRDGKHELTIELIEIGHIFLPSGQMVACDPLTLWQANPFVQTVTVGRYPVTLSVARYPNQTHKRVAMAKVTFRDHPALSWEMAVTASQDIAQLEMGEFYGYGVDSGTGSFLDAQALELLRAKGETYHEMMIDELQKTDFLWANLTLEMESGINVVAFSSGYGDGAYPSSWGYDSNGEVVCLITDFGLFYEG